MKEVKNKSRGGDIREFKKRKSTSDLDKPGTGACTGINRHRATNQMIGKDTLPGSQAIDPRVFSRWTTGGEWPRPRDSKCVCGKNETGGDKTRVYHGHGLFMEQAEQSDLVRSQLDHVTWYVWKYCISRAKLELILIQ